MKNQFLFLFLLFSTFCIGQNEKISFDQQIDSSGAIKLRFAKNVKEAQEIAKNDILKQFIVLYISDLKFTNITRKDRKFEKKYNSYYSIAGCLTGKLEFIEAYNHEIFEYFTKKYNKEWIYEIKKDVIGLENYKAKNK